MQNLKTKFETLLHRHPWALQFSLALAIAVIAVGATGILGVNAATPPFSVIKPVTNDVWTVGESRNIEMRFSQASTKTYVVKFTLCKVNPAICVVADIIPDLEIPSQPIGAVVKATWSQVGFDVNGQLINGIDGFADNNTIISLNVREKGNPSDFGADIQTGAFSILRGVVYVTGQASVDSAMRIGEFRPIHILAAGPIQWGPVDSDGYTGSIALYLLNGDQQLVVGTKKIKPIDFANTGGVTIDHLFGSANFRLGYPADRDYWFRAIVHYDNTVQGGGIGEFNLYSGKFKIDQAGYTVDFISPLDDDSTVWPIDTTQTISYRLVPKIGVFDPFRVENRLDLYLNKHFNTIGDNTISKLQGDISIPANFNPTQTKTFKWAIVKCTIYAFDCSQDPNFKLPDEYLWVSAEIGSVFSGNDFNSGKFKLSDPSQLGGTVKFTSPATNDTIYLGNIYNLAFNRTPSSKDPIKLVLQGEEGINQKDRKVLTAKQDFDGGSLTWAWDTNYFTDSEYGFYHNAYGHGSIFALNPDTDEDYGQSGTFKFDRLVKFTPTVGTQEPIDGTFNWPGVMPPMFEYNAGSTQAINFWVDPEPSHWNISHTVANHVALYVRKTSEATWTLITDTTGITGKGDLNYQWDIPASTTDYNAELMIVAGEGTLDPANPRYYAKSSPFTVKGTPTPGTFSGMYYSFPMDITADGTLSPDMSSANPWSLSTNFNRPTDSIVKFWVGFFACDAFGNNCTNLGLNKTGFDADGYLFVDTTESGVDALLADISGVISPAQITNIRIKIELGTTDTTLTDQPWVQSVSLNYTANGSAQTIGIINFHDTTANGQFAVNKNETVNILVDVTASANFAGTVQMQLGEITNQATNQPDNTIIGNLVTNPAGGQLTLTPNETKSLTLQFTPTAATADGTYTFRLRGFDITNPSSVLSPDPKTGELLVGGTAPTEQFNLQISEVGQTVAKGGTTTYNISVSRVTSPTMYVGTINLATDIRSARIYGNDVELATFNPTTIVFSTSDNASVITKTAVLTVKASANATILEQDKSFSVTGNDDTNSSSDTATLKITANAMTLHVTIPLEAGTKVLDPNRYAQKVHPNFALRVYGGTTRVAEVIGFHTNTTNQADVVITALPAGTYKVFARTTRHLWKRANTDLVVIAGTTDYNLSWPTIGLPASDYNADNWIGVQDFTYIGGSNMGQNGSDLLGDVNNDDWITSLDYSFLIGLFNNLPRYDRGGDPLPDQPL